MRKLAILAASLLAIAGCGGGGGTSPTTVVPLAANVVQFQNGWTWTYSFTGTYTPTGGSTFGATGTRTVTCSTSSAGQLSLAESTTFTANAVTYTHTKNLSYAQAADGSLALTGFSVDSNPAETEATTTYITPGAITATSNVQGVITFSDKTTESDTFRVTGLNLVQLPMGKFSTWTISRTILYGTEVNVNETLSLSPTLGEPLEIVGSGVESDGTYNGTFTLTSTNVPLTTATA